MLKGFTIQYKPENCVMLVVFGLSFNKETSHIWILYYTMLFLIIFRQGIRIKERAMALVWHEKASRTALQTSSLLHTHTLLVQTHNMTTVKEIAEQCRQL